MRDLIATLLRLWQNTIISIDPSPILWRNIATLADGSKLGPHLPSAPQVTFKRTRTMKNIVAPSKLKSLRAGRTMDIRSYFDNRTGIFQCKKKGCLSCQFIQHGQPTFSDRAGNIYNIKQFITFSASLRSTYSNVLASICTWDAQFTPYGSMWGNIDTSYRRVFRNTVSLDILKSIIPKTFGV